MATRTCPECAAQYVASVRRCIDCDVALVDEAPAVEGADGDAPGTAPVALGEGERISYELVGWGNQLKVTLEGMLDNAGIRRVWEVGALIVGADDAERVEGLIATVEGSDVEELAEADEVMAFEIEGLDAESAAELDARLIAAGIAHAWSEEGDLLVALEDEDEVTAIVEAVVEGELDDDVDGLAVNQALSDLYLALDRLLKAPGDDKLVRRFTEAAARVEPMGVPYGFAAQDWTDLKAEVAALVTEAEGEPGDTDESETDAGDDETDDEVVDAEVVDDEPVDDAERFRLHASALRERLLTWI